MSSIQTWFQQSEFLSHLGSSSFKLSRDLGPHVHGRIITPDTALRIPSATGRYSDPSNVKTTRSNLFSISFLLPLHKDMIWYWLNAPNTPVPGGCVPQPAFAAEEACSRSRPCKYSATYLDTTGMIYIRIWSCILMYWLTVQFIQRGRVLAFWREVVRALNSTFHSFSSTRHSSFNSVGFEC
jgi:hypothetical protein